MEGAKSIMIAKLSVASFARLAGLFFVAALALSENVWADDWIQICFDYGCKTRDMVLILDADLDRVESWMGQPADPADERDRLGKAIASLYAVAARTTPIWKDRARNHPKDPDESGKMDCIDHAHNTTAFLTLMQSHGLLAFHQVRSPARRLRIIDEHWSARVTDKTTGQEFAVDPWFFDFGHPAAIIPMDIWRWGRDPDD